MTMGWDAYAVTSVEAADNGQDNLDPVLRAIYVIISERVFDETGRRGQSDGSLGGAFLPYLQCATGMTCIDYTSEEGRLFWSQETVREANTAANWDFALDARFKEVYDARYATPPAYNILELEEEGTFQADKWEVRAFLEACAENDLAILFSW